MSNINFTMRANSAFIWRSFRVINQQQPYDYIYNLHRKKSAISDGRTRAVLSLKNSPPLPPPPPMFLHRSIDVSRTVESYFSSNGFFIGFSNNIRIITIGTRTTCKLIAILTIIGYFTLLLIVITVPLLQIKPSYRFLTGAGGTRRRRLI